MPEIKPEDHDVDSLNRILHRVRAVEVNLETAIATMGAHEIPVLDQVKYHTSAISGLKHIENFAHSANQACQLWLESQGQFKARPSVAARKAKKTKKKRP